MGQSPITRPSLLVRLRDALDTDCWSEFVELYAPLVHAFLRKRGVQDADAADLTQDVLMSVARALDSFEYDPSRSSFHHWLFTIVERRLQNFWRRRELGIRGPGGTEAYQRLTEEPQPSNGHTEEWQQAHQRHLFQVAADQVRKDFRESTWLAFWRTTVEGQSPKQVADALGLSVAAVYMGKRRVISRIRQRVACLQGGSK